MPIKKNLFLTFCTFLCDQIFQEFFSQRIYFELIFKLIVYKRLQKKSKFAEIYQGVSVEKLFFRTTTNSCWLGSTLAFSYRGYSTNLLHRSLITTVSDYVMSFWKDEEGRRKTLSFFSLIKCVSMKV